MTYRTVMNILMTDVSVNRKADRQTLPSTLLGIIPLPAAMALALGEFGASGERVSEPSEIVPAIERGIRATRDGQPALLEFITDKETSVSKF